MKLVTTDSTESDQPGKIKNCSPDEAMPGVGHKKIPKYKHRICSVIMIYSKTNLKVVKTTEQIGLENCQEGSSAPKVIHKQQIYLVIDSVVRYPIV